MLSHEDFMQGLIEGGMPILPREFEMIKNELDQEKKGTIQYRYFLNEVYVTKMFMKEM